MLIKSPVTSWHNTEKYPNISPGALVHDSAILIGDVQVEDGVIICPGVVIRADEGSPIIIGRGTNVQDGVIMHCLKNSSINIGSNCSIAHGALIHGPCRIGDNCFVGFNSVLLNVELGDNCFISHCALVAEVAVGSGKFIPPASVIDIQHKAKDLPDTMENHMEFARKVLVVNEELLKGYKQLNNFDEKKITFFSQQENR